MLPIASSPRDVGEESSDKHDTLIASVSRLVFVFSLLIFTAFTKLLVLFLLALILRMHRNREINRNTISQLIRLNNHLMAVGSAA